jgi:hypothetical protein
MAPLTERAFTASLRSSITITARTSLDQMLMKVRRVMVLVLEKGMPSKFDAVVTTHFNDTKAEWTHNAPAPGSA